MRQSCRLAKDEPLACWRFLGEHLVLCKCLEMRLQGLVEAVEEVEEVKEVEVVEE